ncbi:MAG: RNase J family beta-CASP ribonuclease [Nanoarchaeota archaeon]
MTIEILSIGGYNEVGKNMTAVKVDNDVIIFDAGLYMPAIVELQERENENTGERKLRDIGALPDDEVLDKIGWRSKTKALAIGHAHLDHVGAAPYISYRYKSDIVGTPYTIAVLKRLVEDNSGRIVNPIKTVQPNAIYPIKGTKLSIEFVNMTHSTPQTACMVLHTPEGAVVYANDYKLDNSPILGQPPNYEALKRIGKQGVKALIIDSLYSSEERKTPSEKIARDYLEEVLLTINNEKNAVFVTTFSSHIARLKSIVDFGKKMNRQIIFLGRSLKKYTEASIDSQVCPFKKDIRIGSFKKQVASILKKIEKDRDKYLGVCTGHQGEPGSILERVSRSDLPFNFKKEDTVVFSSRTIPVPINMSNKEQVDKRLKKASVRIFDNVHVSGHGGREDARDLIRLLNPENIVPSHGDLTKTSPMAELAKELGYKLGSSVYLVENGQKITLNK